MEKRLIDADALMELYELGEELEEQAERLHVPIPVIRQNIKDAPTIEAIPVAVMERAILGIDAARQCDQAGRYDYELKSALQTVLKWYHAPVYKEYESRTKL